MTMELRLTLKQSQQLVMTPQLQQAIRLLALSTAELQAVIDKELLDNPLLEEAPDAAETANDATATDPVPESLPPSPDESASRDDRPADDLPFDLADMLFDRHHEPSLVATEDHDDPPFENLVRAGTSLIDHLEEQLRFAIDDPVARRIGADIIGNIDDDGYLDADLSEIAGRHDVDVGEAENVLAIVQGFDPAGVGARTAQECLLIQLRAASQPDPLALRIVEQHFDDVSRRRDADIARALGQPLDQVRMSIDRIACLDLRPGRHFGGGPTCYIAPDVSVHRIGDEYTVVLNEDGLPRLRVSRLYRSLLQRSGDEACQYAEQKVRAAIWLIRSVHQRQRTLRRVTQALVELQRDFLDQGVDHLRPLTLREVAEHIGMHESTVSRITTSKYTETPQGLFALKFFFQSGIAGSDGEMVSSVSVKKTIHGLLAAEDPAHPLSDLAIASILEGRGLAIARRTVTKYREDLGIPHSHRRRLARSRR